MFPAPPPIESQAWEPFPQIDLRQLLRMSDDTGMFQHATFGMPDPNHGYCIDDNARALIAALRYAQVRGYDERAVPLHRYLTFLAYAFNEETGTFRNFMGYDRHWLEETGSQDSQGRTIWALGLTVSLAPEDGIRELAQQLIRKSLPATQNFTHLRSIAFTLIGLDHYLRVQPDDELARSLRDRFAVRLYDARQAHADADWPWWEDVVTYDNAKLCHALLVSGAAMGRSEMIRASLESLRWLLEVQTRSEMSNVECGMSDGDKSEITNFKSGISNFKSQISNPPAPHLSIIGNQGWMVRGGKRAQFDQQPLEAYAMLHACLKAAQITGEAAWAQHAWRCFQWFRGQNDLGLSLYNESTGGCQDGLMESGMNDNQGAESILAYLLSVLELHRYREARSQPVAAERSATVGYAVVGVSRFARFCYDQYQAMDDIEPVAVWNRTAAKARDFASKTGVKAYEDYPALLADPRVRLVHVATTPASHAPLVMQALAAGKHVLVEKPLATDAVDAQRMIQAAAQRDCVLAVNFMMRYGPLSTRIKQIIDSRMIGAPLRAAFVNRAGDDGLPADHWFWDPEVSGGIFVEHGVHFFDLARYLLGDAVVQWAQRSARPKSQVQSPESRVQDSGTMDSGLRTMDVFFDQAVCELRYAQTGTPASEGPATASFYHGFLQPVPLDSQDVRIVFERGELRIAGWIPSELNLHAVLTNSQVERLESMMPREARITTLREFTEGENQMAHRGRRVSVDREVSLKWADPRDKQVIYGDALQSLMRDVVEGIRSPSHRAAPTGDDGLAVLNLALDATRLAKG